MTLAAREHRAAVVEVEMSGLQKLDDDVMAALKSLDLDEPRHEAAATFFQSFPRRRSKPAARRLKLRPEDDDEPPPHAASARIPRARSILIAGNGGNRTGTWSDVANGACGFRHR